MKISYYYPKLIAMLALVMTGLTVNTSFAQSGNVVSNAILAQRAGDLDRAKLNIDLGRKKDDELTKPKFWYTRGQIYFDLVNSKDAKYKTLAGDSGALVVFSSFAKAMQLEQTEKRKEYTDLVIKSRDQVYVILFNGGAEAFQANNFASSYNHFMKAAELRPKDTNVFNNAMTCAYRLKDPNAAENVILAEEAGTGKTSKLSNYITVAQIYQEKEDQTGLQAFVAKARTKYPKEPSLIRVQLKALMDKSMFNEAKPKVQELIAAEPNSGQWVYLMGSLFNQESRALEKENKMQDAFTSKMTALDYYKQAAKIDPKNNTYSYDAGAIVFNRAKAILDSADELQNKDIRARNKNPKLAANPKIKQYISKSDDFFKEAKVYFEAALAAKPDDEQAGNALLQIYARLKDDANFKRIDELLKKLEKK
jgi:tetratricopeptide (TPR) repeat protein